MAHGDLLRLNITVDVGDIKRGAIQILKVIRPSWSEEHVKFKAFTDGITNVLFGVYEEGGFPDDTLLVRIYGEKTELLIDRKQEVENIQILHAAGCAPPLYCVFNNGVCYSFIPGKPLDKVLIRNEHLKKLIAKELAKFHAISPGRLQSSQHDRHAILPQAQLWTKIQKYLDLIPTHFTDQTLQERFVREVKPKDVLQIELNELKSHLETLNSPVVFSHNDLLCKNIIYDKETDKISFIDFEYGGFNYEAFDIGNHFCEYAGVDSPDYSQYPDKIYQIDWLHTYVACYNTACGRSGEPITDTQIEKLYVQVNKFALASHFLWGVWALIQASVSSIDFDFLGYGAARLNEYFDKKEQFLTLKLPKIKLFHRF